MTVSFSFVLHRPRVQALAVALEQLAFAVLAILALTFPLEWTMPLFKAGNMLILTNVKALVGLTLVFWSLSWLLAGRRPEAPRQLVAPAVVWLAVLFVAAVLAPSNQADALKFTGRMTAGVLLAWAAYDLTRSTRSRAEGRTAADPTAIRRGICHSEERSDEESPVAQAERGANRRMPHEQQEILRRSAPQNDRPATFDRSTALPWQRWNVLARALALAGALVAAAGLLDMANLAPVDALLAGFRAGPTRVGNIVRLSSTLVYATIAAMVLELMLPLLLAWALTSRHTLRRLALGLAFAAGVWALVLTLTRSGVAALLIVLAGTALIAWRGQRKATLTQLGAAALLCLVAVAAFVVDPQLGLRLRSETASQWYQATYQTTAQVTARPYEALTVPVQVTNTGLRAWQATGPQAFSLGYHLLQPNGAMLNYDGARSPLAADVPAGATIALQATLVAPAAAGDYTVQWDMVQEAVTWFTWNGSLGAETRLAVAGEPVAAPDFAAAPSPPPDQRLLLPATGRLDLWRVAWRMFRAHPLLGVGPDNFRLVYGAYAGQEQWDQGIHSNSIYVEWLADTGLIGLLAFLWLTWRLGRAVSAGLLPGPGQRPALHAGWLWLLALAGSLAVWHLHGIFDYFFEFMPTLVAFSLLAGLALRASDSLQFARRAHDAHRV